MTQHSTTQHGSNALTNIDNLTQEFPFNYSNWSVVLRFHAIGPLCGDYGAAAIVR